MSMSRIAGLARVKRPVVTTWRRRYPEFPAPATGDAMNPLFDSGQVADWLIGTGRDPESRSAGDLSLHALAGLGAGLAASDLVALLTALICLRDQDGEPVGVAAATCGNPGPPGSSARSSRHIPTFGARPATG